MNIAVLTGGYDAEKVISYKSSQNVADVLSNLGCKAYQIDIQEDRWSLLNTDIEVDKNDFSITIEGKKIKFDTCFVSLHGAPAETGEIQGYFDMLNIPYSGCDAKTMAITMDKILSKDLVDKMLGFHSAKYIRCNEGDSIDLSKVAKIGYPIFVKPNSAGSSFGVTKVYKSEDMQAAIDEAFKHDDKILIEEFIKGREFAQGVIDRNGKIEVLPVTELISENDFFDYEAKYKGKAQEVTPADINDAIFDKMSEISIAIFNLFEMKGFARMDYLMKGEDIYFMEVNGVPGLSDESIYPQMLEAAGISFEDFVKAMLDI